MGKALIVYDGTGKVWSIYAGVEEIPEGMSFLIADLPQEFTCVYVNPTEKEAVFVNEPVEEDNDL